MLRFFVTRLAWAIPIILTIVVVNFFILHAVPGDPVQVLVGDFPVPTEYMEQIRRDFGLDRSLSEQLVLYFQNLFQGNLGYSFANRKPVLDLILQRAPYTLLLMLPALTFASILGIVFALAAAPRAGSTFDGFMTALSLFGYSVPVFWLGQVLVVVFAVWLGWLPAQGMISLRAPSTGWGTVIDILQHMVMPVFAITIYYVAVVARVARASVVDTLGRDFVATARAKGLSRRYVLWRHVLPNAIIPIVTVIGYNFGNCLTGAVLIETVFAWPGLGNLFIGSIGNRDYPVLQGIFLFTAVVVVLANLITDFLYAALDPKVRRSYGQAHG